MWNRVVGLTIGALALASGCATSTATRAESPLEVSASPRRSPPAATQVANGGMYGQVDDRQGPRVDIRAQVTQVSNTRRLRALFTAQDDAYVLVGHVDATGVVRVVFPTDPRDDGFVQGGGKSYQTAEFFGGFAGEYAFRYSNFGRYYGETRDSYDGGGGYLFIIASWRPMNFSKLASGGDWDSYEVTTDAYVRDPRPAIQELASMLVGDTGEAFTLKFASYLSTQDYSPYSSYSGYSTFGLQTCSASFYGWGQTIPWSYLSLNAPFLTSGFGGGTFVYRGRRYAYDSLGDCAVPLPYSPYGYGTFFYPTYPRIASGPITPGNPGTGPITGRSRMLGVSDVGRRPFEPQVPITRLAPEAANDGATASQGMPAQVSPRYRDRGLITAEQPGDPPPQRAPRLGTDAPTRPGIDQTTDRRGRNAYDGSGYTGSRLGVGDSPRAPAERPQVDRPQPMDRPQVVERSRNRDPQVSSPRGSDNPRTSAPRPEQQPMRTAPPPRSEPRTETRTPPPSRSAEPRSEPRSAEPRSAPPRSAPQSSSGSKPTP